MPPTHDPSYKQIFSHPQMVRDLLRGFVKEDWVQDLDYDSLERVSGQYVSDDLRAREDDIVWRIRQRGQWIYIYLLLEFQSSVDPHMAVRLMTYLGLLYRDLIKAKQLTPAGCPRCCRSCSTTASRAGARRRRSSS
jgi:predicted transposase/invertase (TIGR01784 family)